MPISARGGISGTAVAGLLDFKGAIDASANPNYPAAEKGDLHVVSVAGKLGGGSGASVDAGDMAIAIADNAGGTQASVGASWKIIEHNLDGSGLSTIPSGNMLFVDAVNGVDATGTRGRQDKPFLTLTAAKAAASSGDTIHVGPGVYNENNLLKNGVNWHFELGAKVSYVAPSVPAGGIFDDSTTGANAAIVCRITGFGIFETNRISSSVSSSEFSPGNITVTKAGSDITVECAALLSNASNINHYIYLISQTDGKLSVRCPRVLNSASSSAVWWTNGDLNLTCDLLSGGTNAWAIACEDGGTPTGDLYVRANKINGAIAGTTNVTARVWIDALRIVAADSTISLRGGLHYIRAQKIETTGNQACINIATGTIYIEADKIQSNTDCAINANEEGIAYITAKEIITQGSGTEIIRLGWDPAKIVISNALIEKTNNGHAIVANAAKLFLNGCRVKALSGYYPISSSGVDDDYFGSEVTLQNSVLVSGSAASINAGTFGGTLRSYNTFANVGAGAGVTFVVGGLTVDADVNF